VKIEDKIVIIEKKPKTEEERKLVKKLTWK
jgi:hypothetical protein